MTTITVDLPEGHVVASNRDLAIALIAALQAEAEASEQEQEHGVIVLPDED